MKTIEVKVFSISELSDKAKQRAFDDYRNKGYEYSWAGENRKTLEKFAELFNLEITNWNYGDRGSGVSFYFNNDVEELSGLRLLRYIWNNYGSDLFKPKYRNMGKLNLTEKRISHNRVKSREITTGPNKGKFSNSYNSAIFKDNCCVLTGYCMDDSILNPVYEFLKKPTEITFKDLMEDCFNSWVEDCEKDLYYRNSDEFIEEQMEGNDYQFLEDGTRF